jgi:hypothetical protein
MGGMAEEKKRFLWRLTICAAALVILAVALAWYIRRIRRPALLARGYEQIKVGMSRDDVHAILGSPDDRIPNHEGWDDARMGYLLTFQDNRVSDKSKEELPKPVTEEEHVWWADLCHWSERKWKAIFGRHR